MSYKGNILGNTELALERVLEKDTKKLKNEKKLGTLWWLLSIVGPLIVVSIETKHDNVNNA